jgi:hypothetical protein
MKSVLKTTMLAFGLCMAGVSPTQAWWGDNIVTICSAIQAQEYPVAAPDGAGGAIVAWDDDRSYPVRHDIYAQKVDNWGVTTWTADGVPLCTAPGLQLYPAIASDGAGGAIVAWIDQRLPERDIYVQRVNAAGVVQWAHNGVALCTAAANQWTVKIVADGFGGAIAMWSDDRNGTRDIYAQRIDGAGTVLWAADGVAVCATPGDQAAPQIIADGTGGAIITWYDAWSGTRDIYAQSIAGNGARRWGAGGLPICMDSAAQDYPMIASDGADGAIIVWHDTRNGTVDIYAQSVTADGIRRWAPSGMVVCDAASDQWVDAVVPDGAGGAVLMWRDLRRGPTDVYCQRLGITGNTLWAPNGLMLHDDGANRNNLMLASDGTGGAIFSWYSSLMGVDDFYAQWVSGVGIRQWGVPGVRVATNFAPGIGGSIVADGGGGAIVAFTNFNIFARSLGTGRAPSADAGGPYVINTGDDLVLEGAGAGPGAGAVTAEWDLNGDGAADAQGLTPTVSWLTLAALDPPLPRGQAAEIHVRTIDISTQLSAWAKSSLTVYDRNPSPCFTLDRTQVPPGSFVTVDAACSTHPDPRHPIVAYEWFWGDSETASGAGVGCELMPPYVFGQGMLDFPLRLRVTDDRGAVAETQQVVHVVPPVGWCNLQWPPTLNAMAGVPSELVFGQIWIDGVTNPTGAAEGVVAQLGYGPDGVDPTVDSSGWQWQPAVFNLDHGNNDEYMARLTVAAAGSYDYAWRYSFNSGSWVYGDFDGSNNGYSPDQAGSLVVGSPSGVAGTPPAALRLYPNAPNPFNPRTTLRFDLPTAQAVRLAVYDVMGRQVRTLRAGPHAAGTYEVSWDGRDAAGLSVPSGCYYARFESAGTTQVVPMSLVR